MDADLRVVKAHVEGRRYRAVVIDYSNVRDAMRHLRETGRMYPQVFRASSNGWTKAARRECSDWIAAHGR